jgi:cbb3-type cytochrome oxidase subunit 3
MTGVSGVNLYSILVAVVGAIVVLVIYHAIRRRAQERFESARRALQVLVVFSLERP